MIKIGVQVLIESKLNLVRGKRVGLVSHPAAVNTTVTHSSEVLRDAGVNLTALYGPEHGFSGAAKEGAKIGDATDARTGLPVFSLYGETREPNAEMLANVDVLLFDMQDVGVRFYTYLSTLYYTLKGAGQHGKQVIVLDRPDPITGNRVEGRLIDPSFESFIGIIPVPIRYGMTLGEMARYMNETYALGADLTVIEMESWQRGMWFDHTGMPWVITSPAIPHFATTVIYPGMCFTEGVNLSTGRGTSLPFEITGAPYIEPNKLADKLNALKLAGVKFRPLWFEPLGNNYANETCGGVQVHVLDREAAQPLLVGLHLISTVREMYPQEFAWKTRHFDILTGSAHTREAIEAGESADKIFATWQMPAQEFSAKREKFLLY